MSKLASSLSLFLLVTLNSLEALALPSAAVLSVKRSGSSITARVLPNDDASGCRLSLHGAANTSLLNGVLPGATRLITVNGKDSQSAFAVSPVPSLRRRVRSRENLYFRAALQCGEERVLSNISRIALPTVRAQGERDIPRLLLRLRRRIEERSFTLVQAFPGITFEQPVDIQNAGDGSGRLFVVEQPGRIQMLSSSGSSATKSLFLDISGRIRAGGERGLLGLAFHPDFENNGYFYVNYSESVDGNNVIARFQTKSGDPNEGDPNSEFQLLTIVQPPAYSNHKGGAIAFGPDGFLYISSGDGGGAGDPLNSGQDRTSLLGKIHRIDVDQTSTGRNYAIPSSNPFVGNTAGYREEIFAYGLRNPWRISFDSPTGRLYGADVGQNAQEEINLIENGKNYGWKITEGDLCFDPPTACDRTGLTEPLITYGRSEGQSVTGGYVYRGSEIPALSGLYIFGDFMTGRIFSMSHNGLTARRSTLLDTDSYIAAFGTDESGELFFSSYLDGRLYRFSALDLSL